MRMFKHVETRKNIQSTNKYKVQEKGLSFCKYITQLIRVR